jgi:hypothetical protein
MNTKPKHTPTHLFTIRVWAEQLEEGIHEWRGKIQNVSQNEGYYFRGWQDLVELLQTLVSDRDQEAQNEE